METTASQSSLCVLEPVGFHSFMTIIAEISSPSCLIPPQLMWWHTRVIQSLKRQRQEDQDFKVIYPQLQSKFKASLASVRPYVKKKKVLFVRERRYYILS